MAKIHLVKCKYCGESFDANTTPFIKPSSNRYAHKICHEKIINSLTKEEKDKNDFYDYLKKIFKGDYNFPTVNKLVKKYMEEYHYTYSGMKKALIYFYEVKGNSIEKANHSIGIIPYVYKDAYNYYYSIWEANQKNEIKILKPQQQEERVIKILPPVRTVKKRNLFSFLDEEE